MTSPPPPSLDVGDVLRALRGLLPTVERLGDAVCIVGTASSLLRGIRLPVGDVDVLARYRSVVDELATAATAAGGRCVTMPTWVENPGFGQYFAEFECEGLRVEFSTVEVNGSGPAFGECTGDALWQHLDSVELEGHRIRVVASELRLVTEVARGRPDRWEPIGRDLSRTGYDAELLTAAIGELAPELQPVARDAVPRDRAT